jgi:hypothetical protein
MGGYAISFDTSKMCISFGRPPANGLHGGVRRDLPDRIEASYVYDPRGQCE